MSNYYSLTHFPLAHSLALTYLLTNSLTHLLTHLPEDALLRQTVVLGDRLLLGHVDDRYEGGEARLLGALDALVRVRVRAKVRVSSTHWRMGSTSSGTRRHRGIV